MKKIISRSWVNVTMSRQFESIYLLKFLGAQYQYCNIFVEYRNR